MPINSPRIKSVLIVVSLAVVVAVAEFLVHTYLLSLDVFADIPKGVFDSFMLLILMAPFYYVLLKAIEGQSTSEARFSSLAEESLVGICIFKDGRLVYVNPRLGEITGYSTEELLNSPDPVGMLFDKYERLAVKQEILKLVTGEAQTSKREFKGLRKDGSIAYVDMLGSMYNYEGEPAVIASVLDITEHKLADEALLEEKNWVEEVLASMGDGISIQDKDMKVLYQNPAAIGIIGNHVGEYCYKAYEAKDEVCSGCPVSETFRDGKVHTTERTVNVNGREVHLEITSSPLRDLDGNITAGIESVRNITDRREAEAALRKTEELYRTLASNFPNGAVFLFDKDLRYMVADGTGLAEVGLSKEGLEGNTIWEALSTETCEQIEPIYRATLEGNTIVTELPFSGHIYMVRSAPVKDQTGQVYAGLVMTQDITKLKLADAALRESETKYRLLFENMTAGFAYCKMLFDPEGSPVDFVYLDVNDAFVRLTGLENVVGRKVTEVIPGITVSNPELLETYGRVALTGRPERFETEVKSLGIWFSISAYSTERENFVAVFDNITERRLAENALIKNNQELAALNKVADTIASSPDIKSMAYDVLDATLALPFLEVQKKGVLFLRDETDPDKLNMTAHIGIAPELVEMEKQIRMGHCLCGKAAETGEVVTSDDCFTDPGHDTHYDAMKRHGHVVIPIKSKVRVLGVMTFYLEPGTSATEPEIRLLVSIASQLAVAIENRLLFQHIEKANREWKETFDAIEELVTIHSTDFTILRANKAAAKVAGMDVHELIGRKCYEVFHDMDARIPNCPARPLMEGKESGFVREVPIGSATYEINVYPIKEDGRLTAFVHVAKDITERKVAEEALRESEAKFRNLVEQSLVGVYILQDGRFKYVNPRFAEIFGYTQEESITSLNVRDLVFPEDWPIVAENIRKRMEGEVPSVHYTFRCLTKSGSIINIELHGSTTIYEGRLAVLGVLMDITERLAAEEDIVRKTQEAVILRQVSAQFEELNRLKSEFLANMSHELRTPLNAVIGLSQVLIENTYGPLTPKQSEYLGGINQSGRHLLSLINDILDLSKIEAGKEKLGQSYFSMADVLRGSFVLVKEKAMKHGIKLVQEIGPEIGEFYADERRVKQILYNLLSNAVKFTGPGGKVGLKASQDGQALSITVWDTGIGIPEDKKDLLFQPFLQIDSALSRKHEGTGLGLVMTRKLTELHGGTISFESKEGVGTSFTVTLPVVKDERRGLVEGASPTPASPEETVCPKGKKVMVVEDNPLNMLLAADFLRQGGCDVLEATNGEAAILKVAAGRPDIILLDIQMPGMDGFEVIRRLREDPSTRGIPVIAMTALAMKGDEERCIEAGFDDYIAKPIDLSEMLTKVGLHLAK